MRHLISLQPNIQEMKETYEISRPTHHVLLPKVK